MYFSEFFGSTSNFCLEPLEFNEHPYKFTNYFYKTLKGSTQVKELTFSVRTES